MDVFEKMAKAESLIKEALKDRIENVQIIFRQYRVKVVLKDLTIIIIQYNPYEEYSYNVIFSPAELDRIRFDNFDDKWPVSTKPHHKHMRYSKNSIASPMNGNPDHDIPLFINCIKEEE